MASRPANARHRRVRDQRLRRAECRRRRRRGAHRATRSGTRRCTSSSPVRATFTLGDETLDAPAGTIVFIRDPEVRRHARAEEPGTSVLAVGGPRDAGVRAVAVGGLLRRRAPSNGRKLRGVRRRARGRSRRAARITRRRCTTSRAPRRSPGAPTTPSRTCTRALELMPEWARDDGARRGLRVRCASGPTGRCNATRA